MPDGDIALQRFQQRLIKNARDQPHVFENQQAIVTADGHAGCFLTAVLNGIEAKIGQFGYFLARRPHAKYAAFFAGFDLTVIIQGKFWIGRLNAVRISGIAADV